MNLDLDADQALIVDAVHEGLSRTAGPVRTRELGFGLDLACAAELAAGGYLDVAMGGGAGDFLAAVLVIEKGAELLAGVPIGARTLVAPYVGVQDPPTTVALASGDGSVVRYGAEAEAVLMLDGDCVRWLRAGEFAAEPVPSRMAYPLATVTARPGTGQVIGVADAAARMTRSWRVLLAAEIGAAMSAAIDVSRAYVSARTQFGRHIGSLQAVQHRLAQALVQARGATWLARHAQTLMGSLGRIVQHPVATAMTMAVIALALALPLFFNVLLLNTRAATADWNQAFELSVYLTKKAGTERAEAIATQLRARPDVARVRVITAEQALVEFRESSGFGKALDLLDTNPLPSALVVTPAVGASTAQGTQALKAHIASLAEVDTVELDTEWVQRLNALLDVVRRVIWLTGALLALSVVLGVFNLLPVPMLDGGHLAMYLYEAVRGKPLGLRAQELGLRVGFALVVGMALVATFNDIKLLLR